MIRSLMPWTQLVRSGEIPAMKIMRRPLSVAGTTVAVGDALPANLLVNRLPNGQTVPNRIRIRQMYEQRLIEPVVAPKSTRQEAMERMAKAEVERVNPTQVGAVVTHPVMQTAEQVPVSVSVSVDEDVSPAARLKALKDARKARRS
jgi:hypothetical protein